MRIFIYISLFLISISPLLSQPLTMDNATLTTNQLVTDVLLGAGVDASNISFTGVNTAIGTFDGATSNIGLDGGVVLTTGLAGGTFSNSANTTDFEGANGSNASDTDLNNILGTNNTLDATVLEFDFIPLSDTIRFKYVFASEEYNEWVCSQYNDIFAFLLSGGTTINYPAPGTNIALIPSTTIPVAINSVNNGSVGASAGCDPNPATCGGLFGLPCCPTTCQLGGSAFYIDNTGGTTVQYDGFTVVLEAVAEVTPCETYHIKLAIADVGDQAYDSAVFLDAASFTTGIVDIDVATANADDVIVEGCNDATITFTSPSPVASDYNIPYTILGDASNGADYVAIGSTATIPAGQQTVSINLNPIADGIPDNGEKIILEIQTSVCGLDTVEVTILEEVILESPVVNCGPSSSTSISFEWNAVANATGYEISLDGGTTWISPSPGPLTHSITGLSPGDSETLIVRPLGGTLFCSNNDQSNPITCTAENCSISASISDQNDISCNGETDGNATASAVSGLAPFTYLWSANAGSQTSQIATGLAADLYTVTIVDANGCPASTTVQIQEPSEVTVLSVNATTVTCFGGNDGTATTNASGGTGALTYNWSNSQTTATATGLTSGSYTVTVTDVNGCSDTGITLVGQNPQMQIDNITMTPVICNGESNGSTNVFPSGGIGPYTFEWSSGDFTQSVTGLIAGNYTVTVTDNVGCTQIDNITVTEPSLLQLNTISSTPIGCFGQASGTTTVNASGGSGTLNYLWTPGNQTNPTATALGAGIYTVVVTDQNNCSVTETVEVSQPLPLSVDGISATPVDCNGTNTGSVNVNVSGGTPPLTYQWSSGQNTASVSNLPANTYSVTITDLGGCFETTSVVVSEPTALSIDMIMGSALACNGDSNGTTNVVASGGTPPLSYLWSDTQTTPNATGLVAGAYVVTVSDANGCTQVANTTVTEPAGININSTSATPASCFGLNDGTASVSASGGVAPLSYVWNPSGQTTTTALGLTAGNYVVLVTDANSCSTTSMVTVGEPAALAIDNISSLPAACFGSATGSTSATASGGTSPLVYNWSNGQTGQNNINLTAGNYTLTVTDNNGCIITDEVVVGQAPPLVINNISGGALDCNGDTDGIAIVQASGGSGILSYEWSPTGQNTAAANNLGAGIYSVTVTDVEGCSVTGSAEITEPPLLVIDNISATPISCFGGVDGTATVSASGGSAPLSYSWNPTNQTGTTAFGLFEGTYIVEVTDANGCIVTSSVVVSQPTELTLTPPSSTPTLCFGSNEGTATIGATGGTTPYTYQWSGNSGGQTTPTAVGLASGTYFVTITDANGCVKNTSIFVDQPSPMSSSTSMNAVSCLGGNDGNATVVATGGTSPYSYLWDNNAGNQIAATAINLNAGTFVVTITDSNGCTRTDDILVTEPLTAVSTTISGFNVSCNGGSDGFASVFPTGGTGDYSYLWDANTGSQTSATANNLSAGNYSVSVTDENGCVDVASYTITEPSPVVVSLTQQSTGCFGGSDGQAMATASGGTPFSTGTYTYEWSDGQLGPFAIGLTGGQSYSVLVTDANGCTTAGSITVSQPSPLITSITGTQITCFGDSDATVTVNINGGSPPYSYNWSPNADGQTTQTAVGLSIGTYLVTVTDATGCADTGSYTIQQGEPLALSLSATIVECFGDSTGTATANPSGGSTPIGGIYDYAWSNGDSTQTIDSLAAGFYTVTVTDETGCIIVDNVEVLQPDGPVISIAEIIDVSCYGGQNGRVILNTTGGTLPYFYSMDGINYQQSNIFQSLTADDYQIFVRDFYDCAYTLNVTVSEPPELVVDAGEDITIEIGDSTQLEAITTALSDVTYTWTTFDDIEDLSCTDCPNPVASPAITSDFTVTVQNSNGCEASDQVRIIVDKIVRTFVATAFTPNGDGANDAFYVQGGKGISHVQMFRVYDRWGEKVFENRETEINNPDAGWDGTLNGKDMNPGVFAWYAEVVCDNGEVVFMKGDVTLIR